MEDNNEERKENEVRSNHEERRENHEERERKARISIWMISTIVIALLLIISIFTHGFGIKGITGAAVSGDVEENIKNYIKENLIEPGTNIEFGDFEEENGLYKFTIKLMGREFDSYASKDGKLLFPSVIDMTEEIGTTGAQQEPTEIPKMNKPKVELFLMSFCPYGNKAEDTMMPVYNLLKDKVDWNIHYIVSVSGDKISSLHGQPEVDENEREACVLSEYGLDEWWVFTTYVNKNCGSDGSCWESAAKETKLDVNKIKSCVDKKGLNLMKNDEAIADSVGASGSPTLIINGVKSNAVYQYGNSEAYKQAICSAFTTPPEECEEELSVSGTSSTGGSC